MLTTRSCILPLVKNIIPSFSRNSSIVASFMSPPIVELREYKIKTDHVKSYIAATTESAELRKSLVPLRLFTVPETGGTLNVATHFYHYEGGFAERDKCRAAQGGNLEWGRYLGVARPCMIEQKSTVFVEAPLVKEMDEISGLGAAFPEINGESSTGSIYEIRRYKLKLGYDTVPNMLSIYKSGLPSKLTAEGTDPTTSLVTLLYSEVGLLNEVIEIWRHGGGTEAMNRSRNAARGAHEWRKAVGGIADLATEFASAIHKPTSFSPWK